MIAAIDFASLYGKSFEFVQGEICSESVIKHGRSYGDAFMIHEALNKSKLLKECETFYKITGRIFLLNSEAILRTYKKYRNEYIVYMGQGWCFTNIFKANKQDYLRILDSSYLDCDEESRNDIEIVFYKRLLSSEAEVGSFNVYPFFDGKMGATLENYSGPWLERCIRNIMARCKVFTLNSPSSKVIKLIMRIKGVRPYV